MEARAPARWLTALVLAAVPASVIAGERLTVATLLAPGGFQRVAFAELLGREAPPPAFVVEIPTAYRSWEPADSTRGARMWSRLGDYTRIRNGKRHSGLSGVLIAQVSVYVRYLPSANEFRDETGLDEHNLAQRLADHGATAIRVERIDRDDVPMLLVEADLSHREHLRAVYVSVGGGTRKLYYLPQQPWSEADALVWARLRDGILTASLVTATP
jgi:hypothetical protein